MIVERPRSHFVFVLPSAHIRESYNYIRHEGRQLTNREYLESWGKWLVFAQREELDALAAQLDP
jgi:hypothetical protein